MLLYFGYMSIVSYGEQLKLAAYCFTVPQVSSRCNGGLLANRSAFYMPASGL